MRGPGRGRPVVRSTTAAVMAGGGVVLLAAALLAAAGLLGPLAPGRDGPASREVRATLSATAILAGEDTAGYARAVEPRPLVLPDDHGPHPDFRTEWWYFTGNLDGSGGRAFAYQLTFFRSAVAPEAPERRSAWNTNQVWMAHLAITDGDGRRHLHAERIARGAAGLAGAAARPFRVHVDGWEARRSGAGGQSDPGFAEAPAAATWAPDAAPGDPDGGTDVFPIRLAAIEGDWGLELLVEEGKPPVLQGEEGLSRKGPEPGNASHYFSHTRMPTRGWLLLDGERISVRGDSWLDREWSTSALGPEHVGWDWFSLQLADGREIMYFELRREDGRPDRANHGVLVEPDGTYRPLGSGEVEIEVVGRWRSPLDGTPYPSRWRLRIPGEGVDLALEPIVEDQEMNLSVRYWEGAVRAVGQGVEGPVEGRGFVELTGYAPDP